MIMTRKIFECTSCGQLLNNLGLAKIHANVKHHHTFRQYNSSDYLVSIG